MEFQNLVKSLPPTPRELSITNTMRPLKFRAISKLKKDPTFEFTLDSLMRHKIAIAYPEHWHFLEFTGLLDKSGKEIYEGDIVRILYTDWGSQVPNKDGKYELSTEDYMKSISKIAVVVFKGDIYCLQFSGRFGEFTDSIFEGTHGRKEIIGNIYSNPELLK